MSVTPIDVMHLGHRGVISSYLIDGLEPILVDPGPSTSLQGLESGLEEKGIELNDVCHILLTHVHLDHAGGTGHLVDRYPNIVVHVHEDGAPHMVDPEKLISSTRRTWGDKHDNLWGEVIPIPQGRIRAWNPSTLIQVPKIRVFPTPGHIDHHVSYLVEDDGVFLTGDALGIILAPDAPTHPSCPPPSLNVPAWLQTFDDIESIGPDVIGPTHFGLHNDFVGRVRQMRLRLLALQDRVQKAIATGDDSDRAVFESEAREELAQFRPREEIDSYFDAFAAAGDWNGMKFYLERAAMS